MYTITLPVVHYTLVLSSPVPLEVKFRQNSIFCGSFTQQHLFYMRLREVIRGRCVLEQGRGAGVWPKEWGER